MSSPPEYQQRIRQLTDEVKSLRNSLHRKDAQVEKFRKWAELYLLEHPEADTEKDTPDG